LSDWFYLSAPLEPTEVAAVNGAGYVLEKGGSAPKLYKCKFNPGGHDGFARFSVDPKNTYHVTLYGEKEKNDTVSSSKFLSSTSVKVSNGPRAKSATLTLPPDWNWTGEDRDKDPDTLAVEDQDYTSAPPVRTPGAPTTPSGGSSLPVDSSSSPADGGGSPAVAQVKPPGDTVIPGENLAAAAKALNNTYKHLGKDPIGDPATGKAVPTGAVVKSLVAAAPGEAWSDAHVELIFAGAAALSDPNLAAFQSAVRSADAKITESAVKALKDYVVAKMDAGYGAAIKAYAKDANDVTMGTSAATKQDNVFAAALACIVPDIVAARRKSLQDAAETSPQLQSIWPSHDDRNSRARDYAAQIPVMAGLDIGVATHPGDPAIYDLPPSEVVLTMFADPSSFAEKIKELPGLFSPRGGRTRRRSVRGGTRLDESRILREATVDPGTMDTTFFGITAIPTQGLRSGTIPTSLEEPDKPRAGAPPEAASEFATSDLPDLSFDEEEISPPAPAPPAALPPAQSPLEDPPASEEAAEPYAVSDLPDLTIPEDEEQDSQGQTAAPSPPATPSPAPPPPAPVSVSPPPSAEDSLLQGSSLTIPDAQPPAASPVAPAPPAPPTAAPAAPMAPGSIGTDCSAVVSKLALSYQAWDLLSLQEGEDYYVAEEVRVAFQQGRPSMSGLKQLSSDAIARTVVVQIKYQGRFRTIDNAFLSQPGTGGIAAKAVFDKTASAKQGALKFIECFAIDGMDSAGFFAR